MKRTVLSLVVLLLLGSSNVVFAQFVVNGDVETFEGTFPPAGWAVSCYNDYSSTYGCWAKDTNYASGAGFSGNNAQSIYGDYNLDTSLITPSFSTVGFNAVNIEFSGYFYFYSGYGNICDLQYSINGGSTWTTFNTWGTYGSPTEEKIALPAGALGQPNVMLRWKRYTSSYPYYFAVVDNVRLTTPYVAVPTMTAWGMIIFIILSWLGAAYYMRRQSSAKN
jgi:hypothetical protein